MKTRVASSVVVSQTRKAQGGRSELKAWKVVASNGEEKYFAEARPAHAWASRMAAKTEGQVKLFENAGGLTFIFVAAYEDMRPMHKRQKPNMKKRIEALGCAIGKTVGERWDYATKNVAVDVIVRRNK